MVHPAVVFLANSSSGKVLVANVSQYFSEQCLTLLVTLVLAALGVKEFEDVTLNLLLGVALLVLLALVAGFSGPRRDTPLALPVCPHVRKLIRRQKRLIVLPVQSISAEHIIHELRQNCCSFAVAAEVLLHIAGVEHQPDDGANAPVPR